MSDLGTDVLDPYRLDPYDAVLLLSFGGPEKPDDVVPFLENVTRGRGIPRERLAEVGQHYFLFGGRSPINEQCRTLLAALQSEFGERGIATPIYWGNRNWDPYLSDAVTELARHGHRRVVVLTTSAYPSYSSCRQYRENLADAFGGDGLGGVEFAVDRIRHYANHPGFVTASVDATRAALAELERSAPGAADGPRLIFVTHSIPTSMAVTSGPLPRSGDGGYVDWHRAVAAAVTDQVNLERPTALAWDLAYCSRSGPPQQPWTEPDVNDQLATAKADGVSGVVVVPIGFVSDHMEVIYDLDTEAKATAEELGLPFARAATAGAHPAFVSGLVDLLAERAAAARGELVDRPISAGTPGLFRCQPTCCPNSREPGRPALCQSEPGL